MSEALEKAGLHSADSAFLISKARVPLLKTELTVPGSGGQRRIAADICLGVVHGAHAVVLAREQARSRPPCVLSLAPRPHKPARFNRPVPLTPCDILRQCLDTAGAAVALAPGSTPGCRTVAWWRCGRVFRTRHALCDECVSAPTTAFAGHA